MKERESWRAKYNTEIIANGVKNNNNNENEIHTSKRSKGIERKLAIKLEKSKLDSALPLKELESSSSEK